MASIDPGTLREWLDLDVEGELPERERALLERELAADRDLARERSELANLHSLLRESAIPVRPGFQVQVLKSLPAAGWEAQHPRSWWLAVALLLILGGGAAMLVGAGSARLAPESPFLGAVLAVAELFRAAALAGAGMLAASWKGVGLALSASLGGSILGIAAFSALVIGLNVFLFREIRRSRRKLAAQAAPGQRPPSLLR